MDFPHAFGNLQVTVFVNQVFGLDYFVKEIGVFSGVVELGAQPGNECAVDVYMKDDAVHVAKLVKLSLTRLPGNAYLCTS